MKKYGWYQDGECVQETSADAYALINEAIAEFAAGEKLIAQNHGHSDDAVRETIADFVRTMRVGEMRTIEVDQLIDEQDIIDFGCDDSPPMGEADCWELIDVRLADVVSDVEVIVAKDSEPFPAAEKGGKLDAAAVRAWARKNIVFDPSCYCDGRNPIPICLVDGKWIWGDKKHEDADVQAYVVYTTTPAPETGHEGWVWWAQGRMGEAASLKEAMSQAEAKLAQIDEKERSEKAHGR